jgi:hypothetical protein
MHLSRPQQNRGLKRFSIVAMLTGGMGDKKFNLERHLLRAS